MLLQQRHPFDGLQQPERKVGIAMDDETLDNNEGLENTPPADDGAGNDGDGVDYEAKYRELLKEKRSWEKKSRANHKAAATAASDANDAIARAEAAEKELADLKAEKARNGLIAEIAKDKGVDASILARMIGDDREAIEANADVLAGIPQGNSYPKVSDKGESKTPPTTKEEILAIKNPSERRKAIAQNIQLFE